MFCFCFLINGSPFRFIDSEVVRVGAEYLLLICVCEFSSRDFADIVEVIDVDEYQVDITVCINNTVSDKKVSIAWDVDKTEILWIFGCDIVVDMNPISRFVDEQ